MKGSPVPRVLFGAAYYPEYHPSELLKTDLDLMAEARFSVIRVGESVWSTWEPENGRFDLDWLRPTLDGAHERGIGVILGTPTYAAPPWLTRLYPEIAGELRTGERIGWGARQEMDFTHPAFLFHAERVIRKVVERYAGHPSVIGFQVDNEPGLHLLRNHGIFQRFVDWLRHTYGDVETLNEEWGLVYWSHRLSTWADLWQPDGNAQPQYEQAWRRFQADQVTAFIGWQAGIVREYARPGQFVTTCLAYDRPAVADDELTAGLDVAAGNPYYAMQDGLALPARPHATQDWRTRDIWAFYRAADRMYSSRQEPFLVTETNAQAIGAPWVNQPAYDGQWRQAAWALVSRGASMIEYWQWRTLVFGTETYWGGVLPHSGRPGRTYREIARIGAELERAGDLVEGLTPDGDVALLYSHPSKWALAAQPPLQAADGGPDRRSYEAIFDAFYRGAFDAGLQARVVHAGQAVAEDPAALARRHPVLVAAGLYVTDDATLGWLRAYATAGGHLVLGPRTAYADHEARARRDVQPARLAEAAGAWYDEFSNLDADLPVRAADGSPLDLPGQAAGTRWADGLQADGAEVLAGYRHPHFGRFAAATTRAHGAGRVTYVGTLPNPAFGAALFRWLAPDPGPWHPAPSPSVTSTGATARDGRRLRFLHNWSWEETAVPVPVAVRDVLDGTEHAAGTELRLGPWDVRVLAEV
ncbi:beta-galactosidase [Nonomuraea sp. FMUSA5-5]|uniref:beta-galactosidase n=1 Tax=Nonomuraea composti TaxID=2720023 RepID=A0ABX1BIJ8_9ACTN|nr:beta-galactosidase [Nonomuraea sp. FMUSA5-5]NJP97554.1 beta-galactosidase [Nonomuraea sp. FMUSA5-5]